MESLRQARVPVLGQALFCAGKCQLNTLFIQLVYTVGTEQEHGSLIALEVSRIYSLVIIIKVSYLVITESLSITELFSPRFAMNLLIKQYLETFSNSLKLKYSAFLLV